MADHHHGQPPDGDGRRAGLVGGAGGGGDLEIKEQDRLLPIANVGRIMKQILPPNAKISKEAKETMQECVSEFISFVTIESSVILISAERVTNAWRRGERASTATTSSGPWARSASRNTLSPSRSTSRITGRYHSDLLLFPPAPVYWVFIILCVELRGRNVHV